MSFYLRTLGKLSLHREDQAVDPVLSESKPLVILALLAVAPKYTLSRDHLAGLLWPDAEHREARRSLRQGLYRLTKGAERELVRSDNGNVSLALEILDCDLWRLDRAVQARQHERVVDEFEGRFLESMERKLGVEVLEWIDPHNDRLRSAWRDAYQHLIPRYIEQGSGEVALRWARAYAEWEPLSEESRLYLVETLKQVGDEAGAVRAYEQYRSLVQSAVGDRPSKTLTRAVDSVRKRLLADREWKPIAPDTPAPDLVLIERRIIRRLGVPVVLGASVIGIGAFALGRSGAESGPDERLRNSSIETLDARLLAAGGDAGSSTIELVLARDSISERRETLEHPNCSPARDNLRLARGGAIAAIMVNSASGRDLDVIDCESGRAILRLSDRADETFKDFSPDARHLLFGKGWRTDAGTYAEVLLRTEIATGLTDTVAIRDVTTEPEARWSPIGTHIAYVVGEGAERRLRISLADGSSPTLIESPGEVSNPEWSPVARRLSYFVSIDDTPVLYLLNIESGESRRLSPEGVVPNASFWVSDHLLVYSTPSSDELWVADVTSGSQRMLGSLEGAKLLRVAEPETRAVWVDAIEVGGNGSVEAGQPLPLSLRFASADGVSRSAVPAGFRWESLDSTVVAIRGGTVEAVGPGRTEVRATLPGWRSERFWVEVVRLTDSGIRPIFDEDWKAGIRAEAWQLFGSPKPVALPGLSSTGASFFVSNGDQNYLSGAISQESFNAASGLTIEVEGHLPFTGNSFEGWVLGVAEESPAWTVAGPRMLATLSFIGPNHSGVLHGSDGESVDWPMAFDAESWHRYALQVEPDGTTIALMDGAIIGRGPAVVGVPLPPERLMVVLAGSSLDVQIKHGRVQVFEGRKYVLRSVP